MTVDELKAHLLTSNLEDFVDNIVLGTAAEHFSEERVLIVRHALAAKFGVQTAEENVHVVGSAKLGFGVHEKRSREGVQPAFRAFGPESDIDIAVTCPLLFDLVWNELSAFANCQQRIPWDSGYLGDYLLYGWLRPDHFPRGMRLRRCDDWWDAFNALSADSRLGRRKIRGALYHSREHLRRYQVRGLAQCRQKLESQL